MRVSCDTNSNLSTSSKFNIEHYIEQLSQIEIAVFYTCFAKARCTVFSINTMAIQSERKYAMGKNLKGREFGKVITRFSRWKTNRIPRVEK